LPGMEGGQPVDYAFMPASQGGRTAAAAPTQTPQTVPTGGGRPKIFCSISTYNGAEGLGVGGPGGVCACGPSLNFAFQTRREDPNGPARGPTRAGLITCLQDKEEEVVRRLSCPGPTWGMRPGHYFRQTKSRPAEREKERERKEQTGKEKKNI